MTVSVQDPIKSYLGNGSATSFTYPYRLLAEADMRVYINGVLQSPSAYTITDVGSNSGGAVVFTSPPANGTTVILQRLITLNRETDYQEASEIPTDTLDLDLDRVWLAIQDGRAAALEIVGGNLLDAKGQRIVNLANPINAQDAVTKVWAETAQTAQVAQSTSQAVISTTKAAEASASAASALASKNAAAISETNAAASAASALASKNASATSETNAAASAATALADKNTSTAQATIATTKASEAATSAQASADDAAYSAATKQEIIDALANGSVASINGRGGIVVLTSADVGLSNVNNTSDANKPISTAAQVAITQAAPPGACMHFAANTPPAGWLKRNGAAISRTTYAALFAVIGTSYGVGDGSTTFNLPDDRGNFDRGWDDGRGVDTSRAFGSEQTSQNLSHVHGVSDGGHAHGVYDPGHAHGVYDPGHGHSGWTDGQGHHDHANGYRECGVEAGGYGLSGGGGFANRVAVGGMHGSYRTEAGGTHSHNVGVGVNGTGIGIYGAGTGVGVHAAASGVSIQANGGTEARPRNRALLPIIKY